MTVYLFMFAVPAAIAISRIRFTLGVWAIFGSILTLLIGLRYEVSSDWVRYLEFFEDLREADFLEAVTTSDPGYYVINWAVGQIGVGFWLVTLLCGAIFVAGLIRFSMAQPEPALALTVAMPYMVIVMGMGHTRQAAAIGLFMWAIIDLRDRKILKYLLYILLATTFHKTALILMPLGAIAHSRNRLLTFSLGTVLAACIAVFLLLEQLDALWETYIVEQSLYSEGGPIRVLMNAAAAITVILFWKRFRKEGDDIWLWMALCCLACIPLVQIASTAVDRIALYFMPLQIMVWSRFPGIFVPTERIYVRSSLITVYATILLVWLHYSPYREFWIPYKLWPFFD